MGVPVITRVGASPSSRAGLSILTNLGLQDLAAFSDHQFVEAAVRLSRDVPRLRALRANLRQTMEASPLMDGARFAQGVENAYRSMWTDWCAHALPAS
jgi:protein O-GlcNAc transferase